ncbi:paxillin isoform X2 [Heterocephalus glaber]|nr:paxillin isoform X2 [Heterocephalus glaber]
MSSSLGSNLSELDRLLLELNAVQHNSPGFPADEANSSLPLLGALSPQCGIPENNSPVGGKVGPPTKEKPKRNGARGLEDVRPSVESLLDELESSVPSPVPAITVNQGEMSSPQRITSSQQQTRISASSATRELDELMASLSDFKTSSSAVALSSSGLFPVSRPSPAHTLPGPPSPAPLVPFVFLPSTSKCSPQGQGHTPEVLCTEENRRGLLLPVAPSWLDLAGLGVTSDTYNSKSPSAEVSPGSLGAEGQAPVRRDLLNPASEPSMASLCHTPPSVGNTVSQEPGDPKGPQGDPLCPEDAVVATWKWPRALEPSSLETTYGAACSFQEVMEPAVETVDCQAIFSDTWNFEKDCGLQKRARPEPGGLESSCPAPANKEQLGEARPRRGSLVVLGQGPETPRSPEGTPEAAAEARKEQPELPHAMGAPSTTERISTSGQIHSVIRRSRETGHAHPMSREPSPRRRLDPATLSRTPPQEQLIAELQGRLGIQPEAEEAAGPAGASAQDWLTEGIVITVQPRGRRAGGQLVEKVVFPPDSPIPLRRTISVLAPPVPSLQHHRDALASSSSPLPSLPTPSHLGPSVSTHGSPGVQSAGEESHDEDGQGCSLPTPTPHTVKSVGCQTDEDPLFPPMQMHGLEQRADGERQWAAGWPPSSRQSSPEGQDEGGFMAQGKTRSSSPPGGPPKPGSQLDSMLGSLQSDLNKLGVATVAKGVCGACKKPIAGQVVTAMGKTWHPEHFVCTHCQEEIGSRNFFERDGQPYCEKDYHNLFSPRCYYCNGPILDKVVTALDRTWHPEHFFCAQCGAFFGPEGFHEKDGKAYCRKDYFDMFAPKCGGCARAILENYISALNTLWHPECFVCRECFTPFVNGSFFEHDGQPYCEVHYHERRGSLCSGCQKPITGRCITAMAKKFHPEHFVCAFCLKQLNKGTFKEQNDKPYCQNCFLKLFC